MKRIIVVIVLLILVVTMHINLIHTKTLAASDSLNDPFFTPSSQVYVRMFRLYENGFQYQPVTECASGSSYFGCVASGSGRFYPYDTNPGS
jgi:hypothetical protein